MQIGITIPYSVYTCRRVTSSENKASLPRLKILSPPLPDIHPNHDPPPPPSVFHASFEVEIVSSRLYRIDDTSSIRRVKIFTIRNRNGWRSPILSIFLISAPFRAVPRPMPDYSWHGSTDVALASIRLGVSFFDSVH